jgi:prolyl-tRNA synthetase
MTHGDDTGLRTPPRLAPIEIVIIPIFKKDDERDRVVGAAHQLRDDLQAWTGRGATDRLRVRVDARDGMKPGAKYYEWELRGVPLRLELGPRDLEQHAVMAVRRDIADTSPGSTRKQSLSMNDLAPQLARLLETIQGQMLADARARREAATYRGGMDYARFRELMEGEGGFVYAGWNGDPAVEARVKEETKATIRVIPDAEFRSDEAPARCLVTGEKAKHEVLWAKAY